MKTTPYNTHFDYLKNMEAHLGKELGISSWVTITQEDINTFAKMTGDKQWIHVDPERCSKESPYKTPIAHGFFVLSFASKFCYEAYSVGDIVMGVNYGLDKVRFPSATLVNSKVRGCISLLSFEKKDGGARYKVQVTFEVEGQEKPACVAEFIAQAWVG